MAYLAIDKIVEARSYIEINTKKSDTFIGLILFLLCVVESKRNGSYLKADMKRFSEMANDAFYLSDDVTSYSDKYWYALLTNDWIEQVKDYFLKGNKISAKKVMYSLFWAKDFNEIQLIKSQISEDFYDSFFVDDISEADFDQAKFVSKNALLSRYHGSSEALTIKFDGSFVKKKAGDLSGAPFGQTLYAATEIKKIISIFDFDFIEKFDLSYTNNTENFYGNFNRENIKEKFKLWLLKKELSERTAASYSGSAIVFCDKYLKKLKNNEVSLYQLTSEQVLNVLDEFKIIDEWVQADRTGNSMYSAACKRLAEFLADKVNIRLPKPFILLAGISGTGKTRFVREQAAKHNVGNINFCQIPVRPDWHEPSDLLGYISRINGTKYVATKVLKFMIGAWRVVAPNADKGGMGELDLTVAPYWLCLDEMNLAPVEQYFADYLSVLESRKFENGVYTCEALLSQSIFEMEIDDLQKDLGIKADEERLWDYFRTHGISLPPNLIVAGTVNMDETTHGFSRKVIDRACTLDFGEFFPNDYRKFFSGQDVPKTFTYSQLTHATPDTLSSTFDVDGSKTVAFLESINKVLRQTPFELAYRALNELLLNVACFTPKNEAELQAVWDDFLMTKILPRIDGDEDKLRFIGIDKAENLLDALADVLKANMSQIWDDGKTRKDFFRNSYDDNQIDNIPCRSRKKIAWMKDRLAANTFTSFWP